MLIFNLAKLEDENDRTTVFSLYRISNAKGIYGIKR